MLEDNPADSVTDPAFTDDVLPLLTMGQAPSFVPQEALLRVLEHLLPHL